MSYNVQEMDLLEFAGSKLIADAPEGHALAQTMSTSDIQLSIGNPQPSAVDVEQPTGVYEQAGHGNPAKPKRKRALESEDATSKKPRLSSEKATEESQPVPIGINGHKPEPTGIPPAWSEQRGAIASCLPYFNTHQGGLYTKELIAKGMLFDAGVIARDYFDNQVIITSLGGGLVSCKLTGQRLRNKDQIDNYRLFAVQATMAEPKKSLVLIAGSRNPFFPVKPPHEYNVLDFFHITDIWSELVRGHGDQLFKSYRLRFEKVDLSTTSWWTPKPMDPNGKSVGEVIKIGQYSCKLETCVACEQPSKKIYKEGWTCLNKDCARFFHFDHDSNLNPDELRYNEDFLRERTQFSGISPEYSLVPPLPEMTDEETLGSESMYKRGIICPKCGCCCRRKYWSGWVCENSECDFLYNLPLRMVSVENITKENSSTSEESKTYVDGCILKFENSTSTHTFTTYLLPDEKDKDDTKRRRFIGSVTRIRPTGKVLEESGGLNDLYTRFQKFDLGLERRGARCAGSRTEELTSHFSANYGAPYKFGVVVETTTGLPEAKPPIVETLVRLTWAGEASVAESTRLIEAEGLEVPENAIPNTFEKFNELLALGYFEGSKISAHDDGEKELGPTVATLSLGSPSVMKFLPKKGVDIGMDRDRNGKRKNHALSILLRHGDMLVMHGALIQKLYLHEVSSLGKHRFALTCRHIRPESIEDIAQRERALVDGELSEEWADIRYNGEEDRFESSRTGLKVDDYPGSGDMKTIDAVKPDSAKQDEQGASAVPVTPPSASSI